MTNFEFFREQCKTTNNFSCHICYEDDEFETIENDLTWLLQVNEDLVLYFEGAYQVDYGHRIKSESSTFKVINSLSLYQPEFGIIFSDFISNFSFFGFDVLYFLLEGNTTNYKSIESLVYRLHDEYEQQERLADDYDEFEFEYVWNDAIAEWQEFCINKMEDEFEICRKKSMKQIYANQLLNDDLGSILTFVLSDDSIESSTTKRPNHVNPFYHEFCNSIYNFMQSLERKQKVELDKPNIGYRGKPGKEESYYIPFQVVVDKEFLVESFILIQVRVSTHGYNKRQNETIIPIKIKHNDRTDYANKLNKAKKSIIDFIN